MNLFENLRQQEGRELLIGGHQGHTSTTVRENTIPNFELVKDLGLSHLEVDVQLTRDGELVIFHDLELSAKTPLTGPIRRYTVDELKAAFEINTLSEVLCWCEQNSIPPALEIKCHALEMWDDMPVLGRRMAEVLSRHQFGDFGFVFSTDYRTLGQIKSLAPDTALGLIVPFIPQNPLRLMEEMRASIYLCYIDNLSRELVDALHQGGYYVDGSVINGEERLRRALALGVDLIETDTPAQLLPLYRSIL